MNSLLEVLKEINLSEREAQIVQYLYQFGDQPASTIAKQLDWHRSSTYPHLERLIEQGLITQVVKNAITYYSAVSPTALLEQIKRRQKILEQKLIRVKQELLAQQNQSADPSKSRPKVHYFTGQAGLINILDDILSSHPTVLKAFISDSFNQFINLHVADFADRRAKENIPALAIHPTEQSGQSTWISSSSKSRQSRKLPSLFDAGIALLSYGKKTAIISADEQFGMIIESDTINKAHNSLFDFAWRCAQPA